jgi:hypothetical protein
MANLIKSSIYIDFSLGVTIGMLYLSILPLWQSYDRFNISLQTKPNLIAGWNGAVNFGPYFQKIESQMGYGVKVGPWSLFLVLIRSFFCENLVLILTYKDLKCQHCRWPSSYFLIYYILHGKNIGVKSETCSGSRLMQTNSKIQDPLIPNQTGFLHSSSFFFIRLPIFFIILTSSFCHIPTQPQLELELDLIMGRNPPHPNPPTHQERLRHFQAT